MQNAIIFLSAWLAVAFVVAVLIGRSIHRADLRSPSLTDVELDACEFAHDARPSNGGVQVIVLGDQHRLLVNWGQHEIARLHKGQRTELDWPLALSPHGR